MRGKSFRKGIHNSEAQDKAISFAQGCLFYTDYLYPLEGFLNVITSFEPLWCPMVITNATDAFGGKSEF